MDEQASPPKPSEVAEYVCDIAGQLADMAQAAGFAQTAAALMRAQLSALADVHRFQLEKAAPDDAA